METAHTDAIHLAQWSHARSASSSASSAALVTADRAGVVVGWRINENASGANSASGAGVALDVAFHHELKDVLTSIAFMPGYGNKVRENVCGI